MLAIPKKVGKLSCSTKLKLEFLFGKPMSNNQPTVTEATGPNFARPTTTRYGVVFAAFLMSFLLYLDRNSYSFAEKKMKQEINETARKEHEQNADSPGAQAPVAKTDVLTDDHIKWAFSAFFFAYALGQVPAGWLSDFFGPRRILLLYIVVWSVFTGLLGFVNGALSLLVFRAGMGAAQAGAYPTGSAIIGRWMPIGARGTASSLVALGGRVGGAVAPFLTGRFLLHWSWREAFFVYGLAGVAIGAIYWLLVRDSPEQHPGCNQAERELIEKDKPRAGIGRQAVTVPWRAFLTNFNLWMFSLAQVGTNIGWIFLVSWLPRYLEEVHQAPVLEKQLYFFDAATQQWVVDRGLLASIPLALGMLGMVGGGWLTDRMTLAFGLRWGRALPLSLTRFVAMGAYLACMFSPGPLTATMLFCVVAITTDLGVPACWAYSQDVGGKNVGSILGWGNMWGNFGAAIGPPLLLDVTKLFGATSSNWNYCFLTCALAFLTSGICGLFLNAAQPVMTAAADS